ncbi:hypothetical protein MNBD_GAMMA15-658 [hydrothermal vent metagenome]|uniref:DUF218 domain-containing protein n=1 Tax=hydrothermal vent metagenome TaxID=652676 RepID=A0A3B0YWH2_9ZZZZ
MNIESLVRALILPSNLIVVLLVVGVAMLMFTRLRRWTGMVFGASILVYVVFGSGPVAFSLLGSLEYRYPKLGSEINNPAISNIVILTGYAEADPLIPSSSELNPASLYRVTEALLIYRQHPSRKIVISGRGEVPLLMQKLMVLMGVPDIALSLDTGAKNTCASAKNLMSLLGETRFFLVTSAGHMPRAVNCFTHEGAKIAPAPTHFLSRKNPLAATYLPSPKHLLLSDLAIAEYVAMFRDKLAGSPSRRKNTYK